MENEQIEKASKGAKEHDPKAWEYVMAHVKVVRNEQVDGIFNQVESLVVFFDDEFIGMIRRPNGSDRWSAKFSRGSVRASSFKRFMDALAFLVGERMERAIERRPSASATVIPDTHNPAPDAGLQTDNKKIA